MFFSADVNQPDVGTGFTALHHAADNHRHDVMALLIESDADVNAKTKQWGDTPLHLASRKFTMIFY